MAECLVTGGAGFIGSFMAEALLSEGHSVRILDDFSTGSRKNLSSFASDIDLVEGSITDAALVKKMARGVDYVFHEAALVSVAESMRNPEKTMEVNVGGTKNVLDAAVSNNVKKVILASSAAVYGDAAPPLRESVRCAPLSPYGQSKLELERLASEYAKKHSLDSVSLRYFNVYGPRQPADSPYSGVIARFMDAMVKGKRPTICGDGLQTRDFIYVKDVAAANMLAMKAGGAGEAYNIATGNAITLNKLASTISGLLGRDIKPDYAATRPGDIRHSFADISKAKKSLGFAPEYPLEAGLKEMLAASR